MQGGREAAPHVSFHSISSGMGAMHSNSISNCAGGTRRFAVRPAARVGVIGSAVVVEGRSAEGLGCGCVGWRLAEVAQ